MIDSSACMHLNGKLLVENVAYVKIFRDINVLFCIYITLACAKIPSYKCHRHEMRFHGNLQKYEHGQHI